MEIRSVETIVRALNDARVQYLIVGGLAVNAHGYERLTVDVDLVIGLKEENILRALCALQAAGWQIGAPLKAEEFADAARRESLRGKRTWWCSRSGAIFIGVRRLTSSFVSRSISRASWPAKWEPVAGGTAAPIVSYETLIAMKKAAGHNKDLLDIEMLRRLDPYR